MSKYTTEVRTICENLIGLKSPAGYGSVNDILSQVAPLVFNFDWPIFDEAYRRVLEIKILKHFYTREIGLETVGLWKLKLDTKMNEIMPYYNQLYESVDLVTEPVNEIDVTYLEHIDAKSNNTANSTTTTDDSNVYSDTPMDFIEDGLDAIKRGEYASNANYDQGESNTDSTANTNSEQDRLRTEKGHRQSQSDLLLKYRETFINIDLMIIEELETLFMGVW